MLPAPCPRSSVPASRSRSGSTITEYEAVKKTETAVLQTKELIVGAGVSTCAPID